MIDRNFLLLEENKLKRFFSVFRKGGWAKISVIIGFFLIFISLSLGVFFFSFSSFKVISQYPLVAQPLTIYTLAVTFILTSILVFISSIITSLGILFLKEDNSLVFSLPLKIGTIFESRLFDVIFLSSWPLFIFATPLILAYTLSLGLNFSSTAIFLFGTFFLTFLSAQTGVLMALLLTFFAGNCKNKFLGVFLLVAVPLLAVGFIKVILPSPLLGNLESLSIEEISQLVGEQPLMAKFLPTTWLVNLVYFGQESSRVMAKNLFFLLSLYLAVSFLLIILRERVYFQLVNKTYLGQFLAGPWDVIKKNPQSFPYLVRGKMGALTEKDWLIVLRSPAQLFQASFIIFWQLVYFLIISQIPLEKFRQAFPWYQTRLIKINFLFINYLSCVFAMRFFFPMISLEGQSGWIIWSAPFPRMKVFWQKFISSFLIVFSWIQLSTFFSIKILALSLSQQWPLFLINIPLTLTITTITLGIGAIKPNFWEKNPEKLSTSTGGIMATTLCLAYIALVSLLVFSRSGNLLKPLTHLAIWMISGLIIIPTFILVAKKINKYDI